MAQGRKRRRRTRRHNNTRKFKLPENVLKGNAELEEAERREERQHLKELKEEHQELEKIGTNLVAYLWNLPFTLSENDIVGNIQQILFKHAIEGNCKSALHSVKRGCAYVTFDNINTLERFLNLLTMVNIRIGFPPRNVRGKRGYLPKDLYLQGDSIQTSQNPAIKQFSLLCGEYVMFTATNDCYVCVYENSLSIQWQHDFLSHFEAEWNLKNLIKKISLYEEQEGTWTLSFRVSQPPYISTTTLLDSERIVDPTQMNAFGRCRSVRIVIDSTQTKLIDVLREKFLIREIPHEPPLITPIENALEFDDSDLSFNIRLALKCFCADFDLILLPEGFQRQLYCQKENIVTQALYCLARDKHLNYQHIEEIFEYYLNIEEDEDEEEDGEIMNDFVPVTRVTVTPSRVIVSDIAMEQSNCVLRTFSQYLDRFIRVNFTDENLGFLPRYEQGRNIYSRIENILKNGIEICGRHFELLGCSSSQLREGSAWFFARTETLTAESIRLKLGDFGKIKCVAKHSARIGQSFSNTIPSVTIGNRYECIPDVFSDDKEYCFSDGVGTMSPELAKLVQEELELDFTPCTLQIRYQGAKGMLTLNPNMRGDKLIALRPSMIKYPFIDNATDEQARLAICNTPREIRCRLNRPLIMLLSGLGVTDDALRRKLGECKEVIIRGNADAKSSVELIQEYGCARLPSKLWIEQEFDWERTVKAKAPHPERVVIEAFYAGMGVRDDPHFFSIVQAVISKACRDIRKFRYPVEQGCTLVGVLDEEGILNEGEVFFRLSSGRVVPLGDVLVYRSPSLHPGDVRVLKLVDKPELHYLTDCIVFPAKGKRPHANEMSGGDLDGDIFSIIWDTSLFPAKEYQNMDAMVYKPPVEQEEENVTSEQLANHFLNYLKSDSVGLVATIHLIAAEKEPDSVRSEKCIQLAQIHSTAVDFAKTGVVASLPKEMYTILRTYPDFMENSKKANYRSRHIMGELWREAILLETESLHQRTSVISKLLLEENVIDEDFFVHGNEKYLKDAKKDYNYYCKKLRMISRRFDVKNEAEAITGYVSRLSVASKREKRGQDTETMNYQVRDLREQLREDFFNGITISECFKKASAWYRVAYSRKTATIGWSFPWIVGDILLQIKFNHLC